MLNKLKTIYWFIVRPNYWRHMIDYSIRKFKTDHDTLSLREDATNWAKSQSISIKEALKVFSFVSNNSDEFPILPIDLIKEAEALAFKSEVKMGGAGDIDLIYALTKLSRAINVVETGVAYGWSSLSILYALKDVKGSKLVSIDMPYPRMNNEDFVGIVVPNKLRSKWKLIREPDRNGITKAIKYFGNKIDLCHYDSDKSYWGRCYGYPLLWNALSPGGIFISDDIQDNFSFREFAESKKLKFAIVECEKKYVGIIQKPF
jgi:predicted O-methyltransferase YrrM